MAGKSKALGKNVLITGASRGIGKAAAAAFGEAGYDVGINYHSDDTGAKEAAESVRACGRRAELYKGDVGKSDECEKIMDAFIKDFGRIDVLISNAGGILTVPDGEFEDMPIEYWNSQVDFNLNASAYLSRLAIKDMKKNKMPGQIIIVSSILGLITFGSRRALPYCAAKAGLMMLTKSIGYEVAKYGIRVNGIAPGTIVSAATRKRYSEEQFKYFKRRIPCGHVGNPEDITRMMLFLADEKNTHFTVGQTFVVDGGQSSDGLTECMMEDWDKEGGIYFK